MNRSLPPWAAELECSNASLDAALVEGLKRRKPWLLALSLSLLVHAAVLYWPHQLPLTRQGGQSANLWVSLQPLSSSASPKLSLPTAKSAVAFEPSSTAESKAKSKVNAAIEPAAIIAPLPEFTLPEWVSAFAIEQDPNYYAANEVEVRAEPLQAIEPVFPENLLNEQISGLVQLELLIDEYGLVDDIKVVSAIPPGRFDEAAVQAFRYSSWLPALKSGRLVKSKKIIEVCFGNCPQTLVRMPDSATQEDSLQQAKQTDRRER